MTAIRERVSLLIDQSSDGGPGDTYHQIPRPARQTGRSTVTVRISWNCTVNVREPCGLTVTSTVFSSVPRQLGIRRARREGEPVRGNMEGRALGGQASSTASASISTSISGATSPATATRVLAGRMSRKTSPCARPTRSQSAMLVRYMRVRTTSRREAPASASARSMLRSACTAWTYASPIPTILPSGPVAVVPATYTVDPTRTAREYPTTGSHGAPLETLWRDMRETYTPPSGVGTHPPVILDNRIAQCPSGRHRQ